MGLRKGSNLLCLSEKQRSEEKPRIRPSSREKKREEGGLMPTQNKEKGGASVVLSYITLKGPYIISPNFQENAFRKIKGGEKRCEKNR